MASVGYWAMGANCWLVFRTAAQLSRSHTGFLTSHLISTSHFCHILWIKASHTARPKCRGVERQTSPLDESSLKVPLHRDTILEQKEFVVTAQPTQALWPSCLSSHSSVGVLTPDTLHLVAFSHQFLPDRVLGRSAPRSSLDETEGNNRSHSMSEGVTKRHSNCPHAMAFVRSGKLKIKCTQSARVPLEDTTFILELEGFWVPQAGKASEASDISKSL